MKSLAFYYNNVVSYYKAFYFESDYETALIHLNKARENYHHYVSCGGTKSWQSFYELLINQGVNKLI